MATDAELIATARSAALARKAEVLASPQPSYSIGDRSYSWGEYLKQLDETIAACNKQEASISGAAEVDHYGC